MQPPRSLLESTVPISLFVLTILSFLFLAPHFVQPNKFQMAYVPPPKMTPAQREALDRYNQALEKVDTTRYELLTVQAEAMTNKGREAPLDASERKERKATAQELQAQVDLAQKNYERAIEEAATAYAELRKVAPLPTVQPPPPPDPQPTNQQSLMKMLTVPAIFSTVLLLAALVVILSKRYAPTDKHWAYATVGTIIGFWLKG
jgi:hypothetical protein